MVSFNNQEIRRQIRPRTLPMTVIGSEGGCLLQKWVVNDGVLISRQKPKERSQ
jgi:hypothetical protein